MLNSPRAWGISQRAWPPRTLPGIANRSLSARPEMKPVSATGGVRVATGGASGIISARRNAAPRLRPGAMRPWPICTRTCSAFNAVPTGQHCEFSAFLLLLRRRALAVRRSMNGRGCRRPPPRVPPPLPWCNSFRHINSSTAATRPSRRPSTTRRRRSRLLRHRAG